MSSNLRMWTWRIAATLLIAVAVGTVGRAAAHAVAEALRPGPAAARSEGQQESAQVELQLPPAPPGSERPLPDLEHADGRRVLRRYTSSESPESVAGYYRREMHRKGWTLRERLSDRASAEYPGKLMFFSGGGKQCIVAVSTSRISGRTTVSIIAGGIPKSRLSSLAIKEKRRSS